MVVFAVRHDSESRLAGRRPVVMAGSHSLSICPHGGAITSGRRLCPPSVRWPQRATRLLLWGLQDSRLLPDDCSHCQGAAPIHPMSSGPLSPDEHDAQYPSRILQNLLAVRDNVRCINHPSPHYPSVSSPRISRSSAFSRPALLYTSHPHPPPPRRPQKDLLPRDSGCCCCCCWWPG
jgi:hypothetical protein